MLYMPSWRERIRIIMNLLFWISQVITKETLEDFTEDELFPIESVTYTDPQKKGGYGTGTGEIKEWEYP